MYLILQQKKKKKNTAGGFHQTSEVKRYCALNENQIFANRQILLISWRLRKTMRTR